MQIRYLPPTRRSIWPGGDVKLAGPHQRINRAGSVQALKTSSRGASKTRVMTSSRVPVPEPVLLVAKLLLLVLQRLQVLVQAIEAIFPALAVSLQPVGHLA